MDKLFFLGFCLFDTAMYAFVKYFAKLSHITTMEILCYGNVVAVLLLTPVALWRWEKTKKGFMPNLKLFIAAPSSMLKTVAVGSLSVKNVIVMTYLHPAVLVFLSFIMLGEYDKKNLSKYLWLIVSFVGVIVFVGFVDMRSQSLMYGLVFLHVLFKGLINIFTKQLAEDRYTTLFYAKFHYAVFNVATLLFMGITPNMSIMFSPQTIVIVVSLILSQAFLILAYKYADKISLLQNIEYSKLFFGCLLGYMLFGEEMAMRQYIGLLIIVVSIMLSHSADFEMRRYSIFVVVNVKRKYKRYRRHNRK